MALGSKQIDTHYDKSVTCLDHRGVRLPTEAEWEVAARAGARTAYGYGSEVGLLERFAWFTKNNGERGHPPGELLPSIRGAFDLHGNLFEWTHDWFSVFSSEAVNEPKGPTKGSARVRRGGGWDDNAAYCRSANRFMGSPTDRTLNCGFRLALSLSSGTEAPDETDDLTE